VIYNKEVQTTAIETEHSMDYEEELRQRIYREREIEAERAARDKELEEESVKLDEEIEQEIRGTRASPVYDYPNRKANLFQNFRRRNELVSLQRPSSLTSWNNHQRSCNELLMMDMIIFATILLARNPEGEKSHLFYSKSHHQLKR
jgi:hypothetical protein